MTAVLMFGVQFLYNQKFARNNGSDARSALTFQLGCNICGILTISLAALIQNGSLPIHGFGLFTLIMAALSAVNSILFTFCSLRALGRINLSLYSVFSMLSGMALPFLLGVIFFDEELTRGKIVSVALITAALALTVRRGKSSGAGCYIGIFVLNGMSGVISKLYQSAPYRKADEFGYMLTCAAMSAAISAAALALLRGKGSRPDRSSLRAMGVCGTLSYTANLILLIALAHVPASAQYPLVTGGVMAVSTLLACFTQSKPTKREIIPVGLAILGILAMVIV